MLVFCRHFQPSSVLRGKQTKLKTNKHYLITEMRTNPLITSTTLEKIICHPPGGPFVIKIWHVRVFQRTETKKFKLFIISICLI